MRTNPLGRACLLTAGLLLVGPWFACDEEPAGAARCVEGASQLCAAPGCGDEGIQVCNEDGVFEACRCSEPDLGTDRGDTVGRDTIEEPGLADETLPDGPTVDPDVHRADSERDPTTVPSDLGDLGDLGDTTDTTDTADTPPSEADGDSTDAPPAAPLRYVIIVDRHPPGFSPTGTDGADLFGVRLVRPRQRFDAVMVHACVFGSGENFAASECEEVLGPIDREACSTFADPAPAFVSLGGSDGGFLSVSFGDGVALRPGDRIEVYECGASHNPGATPDYYDVFVSAEPRPTPGAVPCAGDVTDEIACFVPD